MPVDIAFDNYTVFARDRHFLQSRNHHQKELGLSQRLENCPLSDLVDEDQHHST